MIDLRTLNVFLVVSECGSFTRAQLEDDLGVVLIDRAARPLGLTRPGSILLD